MRPPKRVFSCSHLAPVWDSQVLWAPGEAMAKLWDTMKTLEGSAENREVKLEELRFGVRVR